MNVEQILTGSQYQSSQFKNAKWLKFDGVDDNVEILNSSFYNLAGKNFTLCIKALVCRLGAGGNSRLIPFIQKGSISTNFYVVGTLGGSYRELGFRFGTLNNSKGFGIPLSVFNIEANLYTSFDVAFIRTGQNGSLSAALNPNNYKVLVNNVMYNCTEVVNLGNLSTDTFTNPNTITINGQVAVDCCRLYLAGYNFYDTDLSVSQIQSVFSGNVPYNSNKGSYNSNSEYGYTLKDNSSVKNNGQLKNYGSTADALTNSVWIDEIIGFTNNSTKLFTAKKALTINKIGRGQHQSPTSTSFTVIHKRGAIEQAVYNLTFGGSLGSNLIDSTNQIAMLKDDTLEITTSGMTVGSNSTGGFTRYGCVCELFWH